MKYLGFSKKKKPTSRKDSLNGPWDSSRSKNEARSSETQLQNTKNAQQDNSRARGSALTPKMNASWRTCVLEPPTTLRNEAVHQPEPSPHVQPHVLHTSTPATVHTQPNERLQGPNSTEKQAYTLLMSTTEGTQINFETLHDTTQSINSTMGQTGVSSIDATEASPKALTSSSLSSGGVQSQASEVWKKLEEFYTRHPDMKGCRSESLETAVDQVLQGLSSLDRKLRDTQRSLKEKDGHISSLQKELHNQSDKIRIQNTTIHDMIREREADQNYISHHRSLWQKDRVKLNQDKLSLREQIDNLKFENEGLRSARESYENYLRKAKGDALAENKSVRERARQQIDKLNQQLSEEAEIHTSQVDLLNQRMGKLENEKLDLENQLFNAVNDRDRRIDALKADIAQLKKTIEEEREKLRSQLENQEAMLTERHQVATKELRSAAEDLRQAFVAREHFKGLRDRDITGKFTRLATEVEDISTLEWDNDDAGNWPLSESELLQIHPNNTRMLKQQIVQSSIWLLLYKHIMQSPFRIMGTEGQQVDEAWHEIWGSQDSFDWPAIPPEIEKNRYEQARIFLTAIEPSAKSSPDNQNLKYSHEIAVERARNELNYALGRVAYLAERDRKILDNIVRLCAKIWLECCSQRYRILVTLPDGLDDLLMLPRRDTHTLRLLVKPDIKRFGTSQGGDITTGESVTGWKGLVERYPKH